MEFLIKIIYILAFNQDDEIYLTKDKNIQTLNFLRIDVKLGKNYKIT